MGVASEVPVAHNRPKTQPQSDTLSNCEGCGVQIEKKKRFCKGCIRRNGLPKERTVSSSSKCMKRQNVVDENSEFCKICLNEIMNHAQNMNQPTTNALPSIPMPQVSTTPFTPKKKTIPKPGQKHQTTTTSGKFVCDICGKDNTGGRIAKGVGKTIGNTTMGVFGTLTFLTGGLTAPLMLGAGMIGAGISGSAEKYSICAECRAK